MEFDLEVLGLNYRALEVNLEDEGRILGRGMELC
jgi:hypothetical protein